MHIKKEYWLVLALIVFLAAILFAGLFVNRYIHSQKSEVGKEIQLVERSDMKLWQGRVLDKPARLIGDYIVFPVEYLNDKQEKARISVIFKPNFKWSQTNSRDFNVGDEIFFFQVIFTFEKSEKEMLFCPVGIFANPPKKK